MSSSSSLNNSKDVDGIPRI